MRIPKDDTVPQLPKANSWNGTTVKAKDPYALMRDSNANTRLVYLRRCQCLTSLIL